MITIVIHSLSFPETFGLVLITAKSVSLESTGLMPSFSPLELMNTLLSPVGIAVASFVRKGNSWNGFVFLTIITLKSINTS